VGAAGLSFVVRKAVRKDTDAILALTTKTLAEHRARFPDHFVSEEPAAKAYLKEIFAKTRKGAAFVAEDSGAVVGWTGFGIFEVPDGNNTHDAMALILDVTVAEGARGRGIGTALVDALVEAARDQGATKLYGDVWVGAPSAGVLTRAGIVPVKTAHELRLAERKKGPPRTNKRNATVLGSIAGLIVILLGIVLYQITSG